ncbi:hypothetical protein QO014_001363 [Kaistia dalseonensis]|uniref:Uncharacterized protein n=1 Tax=Kaistia dalseonensis TaxID=410840 RepID=A0ABU0H536_9HYPH|nr:hypothetical protein [Kaistia dalseonensis]
MWAAFLAGFGRQGGDLFGLGEEIVGVQVPYEAADEPDRHHRFRYQLGGAQNVERQGVPERWGGTPVYFISPA